MYTRQYTRRQAITLSLALLLVLPALFSAPASAGSALTHLPADFYGGTSYETVPTEKGLRLARNESLIGNWTRMDDWPTPRYYHGMAHDGASGVSVLFGGFDGANYLCDTWLFDLAQNAWTIMEAGSGPSARQSPAMAYDSANGVVVLFGGSNASAAFNDTWTLNVAASTWTDMKPADPPPAQWSESFEMVHAASDGLMVLFGGQGQTWTYDVSANAWKQKATSPTPPGRQYHSLAYDSANQLVVLFGGGSGTALNDTWTYDAGLNLWTNVTPASSPRARYGHGMAYDGSAGKMVLFSGYDEHGLILNDTWTFDAGALAWTEMKPSSFPYPRCYFGLVHDEGQGETVLFSGASFGWCSGDTWTYNLTSNSWARKTPAPGERLYPSIAYDESARTVVLFGGNDYTAHFGDTWTYDYRNNLWTDMRPAGAPQARTGGSLVHDGRDGVSILFGGKWGPAAWQTLADTWTYDAGSNTWTNQNPSPAPTARAFHSMACDPVCGAVVLFGGWGVFGITNDTWVFNLSTNLWTQMFPAVSPPARQEAAMAYDAGSGLIVLFGGVAAADLNDTWTYNVSSNAWTKRSPARAPSPRLAQMAPDGVNGELVLAGGCTNDLTRIFNETWTYDVSADAWTPRNPLPWSWGRARCGLASDSSRGVVILFGGGYNGYHGDTWAYSLNSHSPMGGHVSEPVDTGGQAHFGPIEWNASVPDNTTLVFQFRTAPTAEDLEAADFLGPDGTVDTYYMTSGESLFSGHDGSRWFQYRAGFQTGVPAETPLLEEVTVPYNLLQEVFISSPAGDENWSGVQNITWEASDPDGDLLTFEIYLVSENFSRVVPLALNLTNQTSYEWNTTSVPNGNYYMHVIAKDGNPLIPLSANYTSALFSLNNRLPNLPPTAALLGPGDGETVNFTTVKLEWSGSDPDGDDLTYHVFLVDESFDPVNAPPPVASTRDTNYTAFGLKKGATYHWTVLANDGKVNGTISEVWSFNVVANRPPSVELREPGDGVTINTPSVALSWNGSDPDLDRLSYEVIVAPSPFDPASPPPALSITRDTSCPVEDLLNATTYYWTIIPSDGELKGVAPAVRHFTVSVVVPHHAPRVIDHAPSGRSVAVKPTVMVTFDRDMNTTSVFEALSFKPAVDVSGFVRMNNTFQVSLGAELAFSTSYEVMVRTSAVSLDGYRLAAPYFWNFTTIGPGQKDAELPVVSATEPSNNASRVGQWANITIMFSESMNRLVTERAVTFEPFVNVTWFWLNQKGFALRFRPLTPLPNGTIRVSIGSGAQDESGNPLDGNRNGRADGAGDDHSFQFFVGIPPVVNPKLVHKYPEGRDIPANATIRLEFDRPMNLSSLLLSISIRPKVLGNWTADADGKAFMFTPAGKLRPGTRYTVTVSSTAQDADGNRLARDETWSFSTPAAPARKAELPWLVILAALAAVLAAAAVAGAVYLRKRKAGKEAVEAEEAAPAPAARAPAAKAAVPPVASSVPPPPPPPEPFTVEEVYLLYKDGRLMMHAAKRPEAATGASARAAMLKVVQDFLKEVLGRAEDAEAVSMEHGGKKVFFDRGKWTAMAAVTSGAELEGFRDELRSQVRNVEAEVGAILPAWDGSVATLAPVKRFLTALMAFAPQKEEAPDIAGVDKVTLKADIDFHQGYIRLRVGVKNCLTLPVSGAELKLVHNRDALRLERVEPALRTKGDDLLLGDIAPEERVQVSFYLDPQICTESYLEGILTYKDPMGKLETAKMPKKMTSVVCPILYTDENINTAMLKRMSDSELGHRDVKVFTLPSGLTPPQSFGVAKSAIQHHDVKLVREFEEAEPFIGEAWYYGRAKGREDRMVIRARVIAAKNLLEFYVASSSTLMLTGMLAELKSDLKKELDATRGRAVVKPVTDRTQVDALATFKTLLDKASELEKR